MIKVQSYFTAVFMCFTLSIILCNPILARADNEGKLDIIRLKGTYSEIGYDWGKAIKNDLRSSIDNEFSRIYKVD